MHKLFWAEEHFACLRAFARTDDALLLELVHDAPSAGEPDTEFALQHRRRAKARGHDKLHCLPQEIVGVVVGGAIGGDHVAASGRSSRWHSWHAGEVGGRRNRRHSGHCVGGGWSIESWGFAAQNLGVVRADLVVALGAPVLDDLFDFGLFDPCTLKAQRCGTRWVEEQHVALADQSLGTRRAENHSAVLHARHGVGNASWHVGLDQASDDVDRRTLGSNDHVNANGSGLLPNTHDRIFDVASSHHHEVGKLVNNNEDVGQTLELARLTVGAHLALLGLNFAFVERFVVAADIAETALFE